MSEGSLHRRIRSLPLTQEFSKHSYRKLFNKKNVCAVLEEAKANFLENFEIIYSESRKANRVTSAHKHPSFMLAKWFERWFGE